MTVARVTVGYVVRGVLFGVDNVLRQVHVIKEKDMAVSYTHLTLPTKA